jgi:hypothetical protein
MAFVNTTISPSTELDPGSCQAVPIETVLARPINRVSVTPEWIAENDAKQRAYEEKAHYGGRNWGSETRAEENNEGTGIVPAG